MHPAVFRSFAEPLAMARTEKFFHADVSGPHLCIVYWMAASLGPGKGGDRQLPSDDCCSMHVSTIRCVTRRGVTRRGLARCGEAWHGAT